MKVNRINNQINQNFKGGVSNTLSNFVAKHAVGLTALAGSSVIAQKVIMSGSEAVVGPAVDIAVGKAITKVTDEKDGRTNQSSKVQAVRTSAQAIGGTIVGVVVRGLCIAGSTYLLAKAGKKAGSKIADIVAKTDEGKILKPEKDIYEFKEMASRWGKNIGGAVAVLVMMFTNFLVDAPLINWINEKMMSALKMDKQGNKNEAKEAE